MDENDIKNHFVVYVVVSSVTGEYYIGSTSNFSSRSRFHLNDSEQELTCGLQGKTIKKLHCYDDKRKCLDKERQLIALYKNDEKCLNIQINPQENGDIEKMNQWRLKNVEKHRELTRKGILDYWNNIPKENRECRNREQQVSKLVPIKVFKDSKYVGTYDSIRQIHRQIKGLRRASIGKVLKGTQKDHKGYTFKYQEI